VLNIYFNVWIDSFNEKLRSIFDGVNLDKLNEIRLRVGCPVKLLRDGEWVLLKKNELHCEKEDIDFIVNKVTEYSIYAYNEQLKNGFLTTDAGVRIGVAGECVFENDKNLTVKNITSLNIRIPSEINKVDYAIVNKILDHALKNVLIISPPTRGKTTFLKMLLKYVDEHLNYNVLVIDERGEFSRMKCKSCDFIKFSNKLYAFNFGLRSLAPDLVVTDELCSELDWDCVKAAVNSGIKIFASCHAENLDDVKKKPFFCDGLFDRFVVLDCKSHKIGGISGIFDGEYNAI